MDAEATLTVRCFDKYCVRNRKHFCIIGEQGKRHRTELSLIEYIQIRNRTTPMPSLCSFHCAPSLDHELQAVNAVNAEYNPTINISNVDQCEVKPRPDKYDIANE